MGIVRRAVSGAAFLALAACPLAASAQEVNLYTTRETGLIQPLLDAFTKSTSIKVNAIFIKDGLIERVKAEGPNSPADVLMTVDFGGLIDAVDQGDPPVRSKRSLPHPANLPDPDGQWDSLSLRARLVLLQGRVPLTAITYEDLADPKWKCKICSLVQHPYNTSLIAAYLARYGEAMPTLVCWRQGQSRRKPRRRSRGSRALSWRHRDTRRSSFTSLMLIARRARPAQVGDSINAVADLQGRRTHVILPARCRQVSPNKANAQNLLEYPSPTRLNGSMQGELRYPCATAPRSSRSSQASARSNPTR